jgi:Tfp pilus tip-associated adhesin PilY1
MGSWPGEENNWCTSQLDRQKKIFWASSVQKLGKLHRGCRKGKGSEISGEACRVGKWEVRIGMMGSIRNSRSTEARVACFTETCGGGGGEEKRREESVLHGAVFQ